MAAGSLPGSFRQGYFTRPMATALTISSGIFVVTELVLALGVAPTWAPALYSCGLLYLLFLSSYHFFQLILGAQAPA